jgi:hypothetical protein
VTAPLAYDVSAARMKRELEALCTVGGVHVSRNIVQNGHTWLVTFHSMDYPGDLESLLKVDDSGLSGTTPTVQVDGVEEVQQIQCELALFCSVTTTTACTIGGTECPVDETCGYAAFRLQFLSHRTTNIGPPGAWEARDDTMVNPASDPDEIYPRSSHTTIEIEWHNSAERVAEKLNEVWSIGHVEVTYTNGTLCGHNGEVPLVNVRFLGNRHATDVLGNHGDLPTLTAEEVFGGATGCNGEKCVTVVPKTDGLTQMVVGRKAFSHRIAYLSSTGTDYYVRLNSYNKLGYSTHVTPRPKVARPSPRAPTIPQAVNVAVASSTALNVEWIQPVSNGGASVKKYIIEYDTIDSFNSQCGDVSEIQTITIRGNDQAIAGGTYRLRWDRNTYYRNNLGNYEPTDQFAYTDCIAYDDDPDVMANNLREKLAALGDVEVDVSWSGDKTDVWDWGYVYSVTFTSSHNRGNQPQLVAVDFDGTTDSTPDSDGACVAYSGGADPWFCSDSNGVIAQHPGGGRKTCDDATDSTNKCEAYETCGSWVTTATIRDGAHGSPLTRDVWGATTSCSGKNLAPLGFREVVMGETLGSDGSPVVARGKDDPAYSYTVTDLEPGVPYFVRVKTPCRRWSSTPPTAPSTRASSAWRSTASRRSTASTGTRPPRRWSARSRTSPRSTMSPSPAPAARRRTTSGATPSR